MFDPEYETPGPSTFAARTCRTKKTPSRPRLHTKTSALKGAFSVEKRHIVSHVPNLYPESTRYVLSLSQMKRLGNPTQASYQTRSRQYAGFFFSKEKAILRLSGG